jgi:hypothetical protein
MNLVEAIDHVKKAETVLPFVKYNAKGAAIGLCEVGLREKLRSYSRLSFVVNVWLCYSPESALWRRIRQAEAEHLLFEELKRLITESDCKHLKEKLTKRLLSPLMAARKVDSALLDFPLYPLELVRFRDKVYNVKTFEATEPLKEQYWGYCLPFDYDENAKSIKEYVVQGSNRGYSFSNKAIHPHGPEFAAWLESVVGWEQASHLMDAMFSQLSLP